MSISPTHWHNMQMCWFTGLVQSVSPVKLHPNLLVHTNISYSQFFCFTLYTMHQIDQRKSTDTKAACKMVTPGVNFIIISRAASTRTDPKREKDSQIKQLFAISGPACVKAVRKNVDEIDPTGRQKSGRVKFSSVTETTLPRLHLKAEKSLANSFIASLRYLRLNKRL